jgi:hypothetical protein
LIGIKALVIVAAGLYLLSFLTMERVRSAAPLAVSVEPNVEV